MSSTPAAYNDCVAPSRSGATIDAAIGAAALVGALVLALALSSPGATGDNHGGPGALDLLGVGLVVLSAAPIVGWRRAPFGVFTLTACASAVLAGLGYQIGFPLGPTVALHLLAASRDEARPWNTLMTASVALLLVAYLIATGAARDALPTIEVFHIGLAWSAAWFAGERVRLRREQLAELRERAALAERDAERERLLAVAEERARIARDLHDSAGHAINVIAVRAGAARLRHDQDPERSRAALEAIEDLARRTVEEIDHFVGALRHGEPGEVAVPVGVAPPPGLASVDTLVAQHAASGLEVTLSTSGVPRPLGGGTDQAAFRILQEALTNAARHGMGTARVELGFGNESLEVTVTNPVAASSPRANGGGHGLVGMSERATLLGGNLAAGRSGGSYRVRAVLPYGHTGRDRPKGRSDKQSPGRTPEEVGGQ